MKINIIPIEYTHFTQRAAFRMRENEPLATFMTNVSIIIDGSRQRYQTYGSSLANNVCLSITGSFVDGVDLKDGDTLLVSANRTSLETAVSVQVEPVEDDVYVSEGVTFNTVGLAQGMSERLCVCIINEEKRSTVSTAVQIYSKVMELYDQFPAFQNIMAKDEEGNVQEMSLLSLIVKQDEAFIKRAESLLLSMETKYKTLFPVAKQILEGIRVENGFSLLSKEEQVAAFLDFSKLHTSKAVEMVPDRLIEYLEKSPEYEASVEKLLAAGFRKSHTQQFNVLQQVGMFGGSMPGCKSRNVVYNLSDMGAGKTLMTVQAIYMLDCLAISAWSKAPKKENVDITELFLPDKHIIAPALSVKSSWVDTFKLFYEVERVSDTEYRLSTTFDGFTAISYLFVAPFTVRGGKIYTQNKLPSVNCYSAYLIIDEIHQLVRRKIPRTKFFPSKLVPVDCYRIFTLSGTMSNLKAGEWLSLIRFLGDTNILRSATNAKNHTAELSARYRNELQEVAKDLEIFQHRKFNVDDITSENRYIPNVKKKTIIDEDFFMQYGSKILVPNLSGGKLPIELMFANGKYTIATEPEEKDNVSFELFYQIAASSAITAQSLQIAEELFGEQATQHKSSVIKTMSPFTDDEIVLLNTLHKIAADANKYRSANIGRSLNNAILNLNDGLQSKNLYDLISGFADRNSKFLEYLAGLDVNVLEKLPKTGFIKSIPLKETHKFHVLKELLEKEKDETFLIVVNDFYAMKALAEALGIAYLTKQELRDEMAYQELLDELFEKQNIVIVTQDMIKSSLDLVQANRLIQYQLNTEVSDIIQTQNRINRIGQTRETKCYYIAADRLQNALIELFLDSYRNIRVAHKGIVELFADLSSQVDVINDYLDVAFKKLEDENPEEIETVQDVEPIVEAENVIDLVEAVKIPNGYHIQENQGICNAILFPEKKGISVIVPLKDGNPFKLGLLKDGIISAITVPTKAVWNLNEMRLVI